MILIILILVLIEALSLATLRQHLFLLHRTRYHVLLLIHLILSTWFWILVAGIIGHESFFDTPGNIWMLMALAGMVSAVILPRLLLIILHFTGKLIMGKRGGNIKWLTNTGLIISFIVLIAVGIGTFFGKFNFRYESVEVKVKGLHPDLEGLKIIHISDLHLAGFYHHSHVLPRIITRINSLQPDIIVNTGDFITFGWREYGRNDTVLARSKSRYGNFAVIGNHDAGTYHPEYTQADLYNHRLIMNNLIETSGYRVLNDDYERIQVGGAVIGMIGVTTAGRHPEILHGSIDDAMSGLDSTDLNILLTHDPNHWLEQIAGKRTDIELSLSGHTHGMQVGIMTRKFRWSPSKYFYPHWNGLYHEGDQMHYVNRGLGVLAIPFRLWMPPEITIITLLADD